MGDDAELPDFFPDDSDIHDYRSYRAIRCGEFRHYLNFLTASEDFEPFLQLMFNAAIQQRQVASLAPKPSGDVGLVATSAPQPATQEIDIVVPDGVVAGQVLAVDFLGARYELVVPEGCGPGASFRAVVTVPSPVV